MAAPNTRRVRDPAALRAVAHPLRVRLLAALRADGPATASQLGRRFGESSGSTSYHLRQLARFGFVEPDPDQPNARDRRWRAVHEFTSWRDSDFADDEEGQAAIALIRDRQRANLDRTATQFVAQEWDNAWRDAAGMSDLLARLSPASLTALHNQVVTLIRQYEARDDAAPDAERVAIWLAGYPVREYPT
ncbi:MAG: helix-turn-helix transcriptional regulator [Jiangellaceae bacterium]|nr:helix-turn-helix transcriptional regulator [Jiangellaceae bacterium]